MLSIIVLGATLALGQREDESRPPPPRWPLMVALQGTYPGYVLDENRELRRNCNTEMVGTGPLDDPAEVELVLTMLRRHRELTGSKRAHHVLVSWSLFRPLFVRVIPHDYRRVIEAQNRMLASGLSREEAEMAAFDENVMDARRVAGN